MSNYRNYYDSSYGKSRPDSVSKNLSDTRSTPSRIAQRYGGGYTSSLSTSRDTGRGLKTDPHPPVSYKSPLSRSGTRSRDPSPSLEKVERTTPSTSSSYLNPNRLYPRQYTRSSTSRESTVSPTGSVSNLPRLGKRDDSTNIVSKYGGRTPLSKDSSSRSSSVSKEESISSKYKSSREDLSSGSQKYLNSRFLPKNSVERSYTAYTRPSTVRTHEVSRKNKELLSVLHAQQEQEKMSSRPASRCSSVAPEEVQKIKKKSPEKEKVIKKVEMITLKVCTRGTSPTLGSATQPSFLRSRRIELAKTIEKTVTRPKTVSENMVDKGIQSDRLDDSTKSSRFAGSSRINSTPWSSFLDMKFSSPSTKKTEKTKADSTDSPKSLSRTSSTKSISSDKDSKKSSKSKLTPPKQLNDKKQLPPPIPKSETSTKGTLHSLNTPNKDFRKSVLNMNPDGSKKRLGRRSNSASSADSDNADPDATDVSENLTSCKSYHKSSSSSKLPQKCSTDKQRGRRSPSSDVSVSSTTGPSSSEDDIKRGKTKSAGSSRTSVTEDFSTDKSSKEQSKSKQKMDGTRNEADAKNFLMRALAPVTNLFKANRQSQSNLEIANDNQTENSENPDKVVWILDPSSDSVSEKPSYSLQSVNSEPKSAKIVLRRVECADQSGWWGDNSETPSENSQIKQISEPVNLKYREPEKLFNQKPVTMKQNSSGEAPWWLDPNQSAPEGVQTYPENVNYKVKHADSGDSNWCLDENSATSESIPAYPNWKPQEPGQIYSQQYDQNQCRSKPPIRHIHSGESAWWLEENQSNAPEGVFVYPSQTQEMLDNQPQNRLNQAKIRPVESGEVAWWIKKDGTPPEGIKTWSPSPNQEQNDNQKTKMRPVDSGEAPWWLNKEATPPEGVQTYPNWVPDPSSSSKLSRNDSENSNWWQDSSKSEGQTASSNEQKTFGGGLDFHEKHKLRHIDSGERAWWLNDDDTQQSEIVQEVQPKTKTMIRHQESGEKPWWLGEENHEESYESQEIPLGDRASPEGLEMPKDDEGRNSPYDNVPGLQESAKQPSQSMFISKHRNIDELLGGMGQLWGTFTSNFFGYDDEGEKYKKIDAKEVIIHEGSGKQNERSSPYKKLDDAALQLYKDGDYGSYLDLEASISEQQEEFEGFELNKKNSIVLRTQLSVRVHTIIEKLLTSEGRELRRALFSLKQIFQEDKDLVHEFVQNDGLSCLIKVGSEADQNYQNYILRALGQVMLYVDGMNGVMEHNQTIQWLYSLISSKFRLVVKTALKLLLVFVEYTDSNCMLLVKAIHTVDYTQGLFPYHNIMKLLKDFDSADTELLIYATTLINKILNAVPDQDTYYDQVDALEEQGIESIIQRYMSKPGTDLDLLQQFQIYEAVLQFEDGEEKGGCTPIRHLDENIRKTLRSRKSMTDNSERRKSRRHSTGTAPLYGGLIPRNNNHILPEDFDESSSSNSGLNSSQWNGSYKDSNKGNYTNALQQRLSNGNKISNRKDMTPYLNAMNKMDSEEKQPWIMSMIQSQEGLQESDIANENDRNILLQLKKDNTIKDITQKLANQSIVQSPTEEMKVNRLGDMSGLISKAKEGLAKSKSKADVLKNPTSENILKIEPKKSENELRWEELVANLNRPLNLCDMDFTDLVSDDETDVLAPATPLNGIPPPPPPPMGGRMPGVPPPVPSAPLFAPPVPNAPLFAPKSNSSKNGDTRIPVKKNKKTVKLFWKEVRDDPISHSKLKTGYIWDELSAVTVDTQKLEHLFESRAKDLISKEKQQELNKNKEIIVLDPKRSNAINIGMTKLPPPRSIKTAILKMDATIMNREGIEKLLTMLPTEEERTKIQEAQAANPDLPLGSAEQFLLTLASISELPARLKLWAFKLDFENSEREIAEPLMDLKQGFEVLKINKTFRAILSTLLSVGNFLNGNEVKGFQIEYLTKVPEVKDTVHKHSLLHHLCHIVMEKFPEATDLYSEVS
ncbi:uncharacterized protein LOC115874811 isoform X2 [Sitophilus oryzae]|uniref:Uncharacterized protein LOC115874811 isoform X2 n=1 Tax=Sitophilus oryzae TaxID=7048 RepID=A0A6J2X4N6_SITOR|nr:uncharacterized protein LOC115874811 isoform X2 [Sitophilus oryzae]